MPALRDRNLEALAELFPPAGAPDVVATLAQEATGTVIEARAGALLDVRYHPTRTCVALWSFPSPGDCQVLVSGRLFSDARGAEIVAQPAFQRLARQVSRRGSPAYAYLPSQRLLLQVFPLDARLPGLALAARPDWVAQALSRSTLGARVKQLDEATPVAYKAHKRCVIRYTATNGAERTRYFGKVFRDDRGAQMCDNLQALSARLARSGSPWATVAPSLYVPEARLLVSAGVEDGMELGTLFDDAASNAQARARLKRCIQRIADGLRSFGECSVTGLPVLSPETILGELQARISKVRAVEPVFGSALQTRVGELRDEARRLTPEAIGLTHRAFRHHHFIARGEELVLLDLDDLCLAGASANAGSFLAYLDRTAARRPRLREVSEECMRVFFEAVEEDGWVDPAWLDWHRAATRVQWAQRAFFALHPKWPPLTAELLASRDIRNSGAAEFLNSSPHG